VTLVENRLRRQLRRLGLHAEDPAAIRHERMPLDKRGRRQRPAISHP